MGEATQTPTLEQTLNKTDFGHILYEYRRIFFGLVLAILVGVTGWVLWKESQKAAALETSIKVFEFQSKEWSDGKAGKITPTELVIAFEKLPMVAKQAPVMVPIALEMGKFLYEKGAVIEAEAILSKVDGSVHHPVSAFFIGMQRAAVLEKLGKNDEAIGVLEKLAKLKEVLMPAKVANELGRLFLAKGEKGKAQSQFEQVVSTYPNDEQAKLAKLYLAQLAQ